MGGVSISVFLDNSMRNRLNINGSALSLFLQKPKTAKLFVEKKKKKTILPNVCGKFPKSVEVI